jgi:prolyl-tRNA synthetase
VVVRPTSETIINTYFSKWVQSYRDLPLRVNQWCNVVRWELRPRLFLRTTEFLWQEGHTCHATFEDARAYAETILYDVYADFMVNVLAIPVLTGRKTARERFPGAINTTACEAMMIDGKALQMGTSHELGQNFAKAFGTQFTSESGSIEHVWQTSWGVSTRMMGGLIMAHGDDAGLRLPPRIAPVQVVVVLVKGEDGAGEVATRLTAELRAAGVRVELDDRTDTSFGRRAVDWELKGVPVRIEVGPRDVAAGQVTLVRRDTASKEAADLVGVAAAVPGLLDQIQVDLLEAATVRRDAHTVDVETIGDAVETTTDGFARIPWRTVLATDGETSLREQGVTVRCLRRPDGSVPEDEDEPDIVAVVGRAY